MHFIRTNGLSAMVSTILQPGSKFWMRLPFLFMGVLVTLYRPVSKAAIPQGIISTVIVTSFQTEQRIYIHIINAMI